MKKKLVVLGMMVMMALTTAGCKKQECIACGEMKKCNEQNIGGEHYTYVMNALKSWTKF